MIMGYLGSLNVGKRNAYTPPTYHETCGRFSGFHATFGRAHINMYVFMYACMYVCMYVCMYALKHGCMCVSVYVFVCS